MRILIATVYLRTRNESLKSCIILPVRWSVKQFFAPNSPIFGIRLPKKQEEKEEEHRKLQSVMCFTQTQRIICLNYYVFFACLQWLIVRFPYRFLANFSLKNVKMKLDSKWFKRKNIVLIFRNSFVLCRNLKSCINSPENQNTIWSTPTLLWAADFFWPSIDAHSPIMNFFTWLYTAKPVHRDIQLVVNR